DRHLLALDVVAEHLDPALVEREQARDEPDQRRLARAIGAQDPDRATALESERDVVDRDHRALLAPDLEALGDSIDEQRGHAPRTATDAAAAVRCDPRDGQSRWIERSVLRRLRLLERRARHRSFPWLRGHGHMRKPLADPAVAGGSRLVGRSRVQPGTNEKPWARSGPRFVVPAC